MVETTICLCWLDECDCQFQRHRNGITICESYEIWKLCTENEDLNRGYDIKKEG